MEGNVTLIAAFAAGLLSFISPCVLPLIPGYLSYISGLSMDEMQGSSSEINQGSSATSTMARRQVLLATLAFVVGFSLVFISLGASASVLGQFLMERLTILSKVAGAIIVVFGLHTMGILRIGWLYSEKRIQTKGKPVGLLGAMLVGIAFAFGWTPCIGPILAGILAVAGAQDTIGEGVQLLAVYSAGLAVPFIATSLAVNRFFAAFGRIRKHYHKVEIVSGLLLIVIGVLIFTDRFTVSARWLTPYLPVF